MESTVVRMATLITREEVEYDYFVERHPLAFLDRRNCEAAEFRVCLESLLLLLVPDNDEAWCTEFGILGIRAFILKEFIEKAC